MLVLAAILLTLVPAALILWPFVFAPRRSEFDYDEGAPQADLARRWESASAGLASAELDYALGNQTREDYRAVSDRLMAEAASALSEMELSPDEEERMIAELRDEIRRVRARQGVLGDDDGE